MHVPVLTYHAVNVAGSSYADNDHIAFAADLALIHRLGLRVVPVHWLVDQLLGRVERDLSGCVALTCDDGSDLDVRDLAWPGHGMQRSLLNCMHDFVDAHGNAAQPDLHLTAFVIASPEARARLDQRALFGHGWMNEDWWPEAMASGRMAIENHSWDHNHGDLDAPGPDGMPRGDFLAVNNAVRAESEIVQAARYIDSRIAPARTRLFCYPFGQVPDFVRDEWLPALGETHGIDAAFGVEPSAITMTSDRWNLPRYVCGWHWTSPQALEAILLDSGCR